VCALPCLLYYAWLTGSIAINDLARCRLVTIVGPTRLTLAVPIIFFVGQMPDNLQRKQLSFWRYPNFLATREVSVLFLHPVTDRYTCTPNYRMPTAAWHLAGKDVKTTCIAYSLFLHLCMFSRDVQMDFESEAKCESQLTNRLCKNNNNNNNFLNTSACQLCGNLGRKIFSSSGDYREGAFLFQRVSVLVQRFNAVLLHGSLPTPDCTD